MQSSFLVWDEDKLGDDIALQFTVDQKEEFVNGLIEDCGSVETVAELRKRALDMCMVQPVTYPGPLGHAYIYYVEETKCAGVIYNSRSEVS